MTTHDSAEQGLDAYLVGGFVRDRLLDRPHNDRDWVVVGSTPEEMLARGFQQVGRDFPVFLHPRSKEEYALARGRDTDGNLTTGPGISLDEDLARRDLTINAIAMDREGRIIDPFHGRQDLEQRILRHLPSFSDDPLRILRLARLAAGLDFSIAEETATLARNLTERGDLSSLAPERIWQELRRALCTPSPRRFVEVLRELGALKAILPEVDALFGIPQPEKYHPEIDTGIHVLMALDRVTELTTDPLVRFAVLVHDLGKAVTPPEYWPSHRGHEALGVPLVDRVCRRLRIPEHYRKLARKTSRYHLMVHLALELKPRTLAKLLDDLDAWRAPEDFERFLLACQSDAQGRKGPRISLIPRQTICAVSIHSPGTFPPGTYPPISTENRSAEKFISCAAAGSPHSGSSVPPVIFPGRMTPGLEAAKLAEMNRRASIRQACLRPRDRFWDIPVPKIDSAFDNLLVPQQSWSPSTTQQPRKLVAAPYLAPI